MPVGKAILRLRKARSSAFDDCSSSAGTSWGSASMMVTSAPNERHTLANSQPITPPPSTITDAGTDSRPQRVLGGEHPHAVDLEAGQGARVGARREHDRLADVRRAVDLDRARPGEPAGALDDGDPAALDSPVRPLNSRLTTPSL